MNTVTERAAPVKSEPVAALSHAVFLRDRCCRWCRSRKRADLTMALIVPASYGGVEDMGNSWLLCHRCVQARPLVDRIPPRPDAPQTLHRILHLPGVGARVQRLLKDAALAKDSGGKRYNRLDTWDALKQRAGEWLGSFVRWPCGWEADLSREDLALVRSSKGWDAVMGAVGDLLPADATDHA